MMSDLFHTILELLSFTELFLFFCLIACITPIHSIICIRKTNFENTLATEIGMGFLLIFISFLWKYLPFYFLFFFALFFFICSSFPFCSKFYYRCLCRRFTHEFSKNFSQERNLHGNVTGTLSGYKYICIYRTYMYSTTKRVNCMKKANVLPVYMYSNAL